ncbi:MAG: phosphomethylpyrimidine kinase, partial [Lachnospiraceae bacterium]|nr:phosphomethylpyrimidine kinase [Lachnospiraceae bacterium]
KQCIEKAVELQTPATDGVPFEALLHRLKRN